MSIFLTRSSNDRLEGGSGNDTYLFARGSGADTVYDDDWINNNVDELRFADIVSTEVVSLTRLGNDLKIDLGGGDVVTVQINFYSSSYRVEKFSFSDGVSWSDSDITSRVITYGTTGSDDITGYSGGENRIYGLGGNDKLIGNTGNDYIEAADGNDELYGEEGDDTLVAGAGNDNLYGGSGEDTLTGGAGNDRLEGGAGNDTYLFTNDFGTDAVVDYDSSSGNTDLLMFGDLSAEQLWFEQQQQDLRVSAIGTTNSVTVIGWFNGVNNRVNNRVEQFQASDGQVLAANQVNNLIQAMADFAPPAAGQTSLPQDYRNTLSPVIAANWS